MAELTITSPTLGDDIRIAVESLPIDPGSAIILYYPAGVIEARDLLVEVGRQLAEKFNTQVLLFPNGYSIATITKEELQRLGIVSQ